MSAKLFPSGCVASPHYLASASGFAVLADGGNALDAAIATNLTLGVVSPYMCGYGGDLFALIWAPPERSGGTNGQLHAYNGSGRAPAAATLDAVRAGVGGDSMPGKGPWSVTVPGAVEAWFTLIERFGTKEFPELAAQALRYARDGFSISSAVAAYFTGSAPLYEEEWGRAWRDIYGSADETVPVRQSALARTIQALCDEGPDVYYRGPIAEAIADTLQSHGALMKADDLAAHAGDWVLPISAPYRDAEVFQLPPNSQGVTALEALVIAEGLDLGPAESAHRQHVLIESMKLALADRNDHVTDIDHMTIDPVELASSSWTDERRKNVDLERASSPVSTRAVSGGTAYLCAADSEGMLVSLIQSNYTGFGSGVTVADWGINLQNRGAYFSLDPGHANAIAPGKRTMHTLMPAMAFREGAPWLVFGTMGGDGQPQTQLQFLTRVLDDSLDIQDAIDAPRWAVAPDTWAVTAESRFDASIVDGLRERGHTVATVGRFATQMGHAHAIERRGTGYAAATDPRAEGAALGL